MPAEPRERVTRLYSAGIEIDHRFGREDGYDDITLDVDSYEDTFGIGLVRSIGRDRDNYHASHHGEIKLNADEAREVYLALHVWLEQR